MEPTALAMAYAGVQMPASTPPLVRSFYDRIWNAGDFEAATEIVAETFVFRGSLGTELSGRSAFLQYARSVRTALADYRCDVLECVAEDDRNSHERHASRPDSLTLKLVEDRGRVAVEPHLVRRP